VNSIKSLAAVALLAALGIGLYVRINSRPEPTPPPEFGDQKWDTAPEIDFGSAGGSVAGDAHTPAGGEAPKFDSGTPDQEAPPFDSTASSEAPKFEPSARADAPAFEPSDDGAPQQFVPPEAETDAPPFNSGAAGEVPLPSDQSSHSHPPTNDPFVKPAHASMDLAPRQVPAGQVFDDVLREARQRLGEGRLAEGLAMLSPWYGHASLTASEQYELTNLLSQLAGTVLYSREHHVLPPYVVVSGDTLEGVARRHNIPAQLLANINGLDVDSPLQPGSELKVLRGPFHATVQLGAGEMVLTVDGYYAGRFDISLGSDAQQPEGQYTVTGKEQNPTYYGRQRTIPGDDPANPLGSHFVRLAKSLNNQAVGRMGIHGTSAGQVHDSRGYIRLAEQDAADAFAILSQGSQVIIRR